MPHLLEPEWEARFEPKSYGFRPGRSCHDAIQAIYTVCRGPQAKRVWALDADLAAAFDKIDHSRLLELLGSFPARDLILDWVKAGVFEAGKGFAPTEEGTMRRRRDQWAEAGHGPALLRICLTAYDRIIGLDLDELAVDGAITKAPCGGEVAGRSPVDRGKQGLKRSVATDGQGIPLHLVAARAGDHDSPLLEPTLTGIVDMIGTLPQYHDLRGRDDFPTVHLDRGYDSAKTRALLHLLGFDADIAVKGQPAPIQAGRRWPVERTHSWLNGYGKLRRCTDKRKVVVEFWLYLAAALTVIRRLINQARNRYRWPHRPTTRRLR